MNRSGISFRNRKDNSPLRVSESLENESFHQEESNVPPLFYNAMVFICFLKTAHRSKKLKGATIFVKLNEGLKNNFYFEKNN